MAFKRIKEVKKKSAYVAEQIIDSINNSEYKPGDQLPAERKIAQQMGVSRNSVREALSALQIVNVVNTKAGSGTYIKSKPEGINIHEALTLAKGSEDLLEIWEARREIEKILTRLALKRADQKELNKLRSSLNEIKQAVNKEDYEGYQRANKNFHLTIAELADNAYLRDAVKALLEVTREHLLRNMVEDYPRYMKDSLYIHQKIFDLIGKGNQEKIEEAVDSHFQELEEYLEERLFKD